MRRPCAPTRQFHPESILSDGGATMLANFLALSGGTWEAAAAEAARAVVGTGAAVERGIITIVRGPADLATAAGAAASE